MKNRSLTELIITGTAAIGLTTAFIYNSWIAPIQQYQYNDHAALSASVANVKSLTSSIADIQSRVDWLSEQKGYQADSTNETSFNQ